ncbi:N-(5'-phosphoribosyl)anthranilate isomerase [Paenibacillus plantiphilus]|uniref:N-(5'-phosphoribosyl)anthranilate isomerase n=1 Tax=Paenibacillus plantiphilus TaxID=2905650 RepID=A0ABM9CP01_9BACL|nr:phosphoribosylanthranilate isomerase [Paenibacillus plantiphilus]CAH1218270.1 N-(5'-phosphoribosyl)anthranilate isomerase [Paenibacillus plantiphilus]
MSAAETHSTRVKICGLRDVETIRAMNGLPVDELGFMFAGSKRQVSPELAAELIAEAGKLRSPAGHAPRMVGVFVNGELEQLRELLAIAPLDVIQLHGEETPAICAAIKSQLGIEVWKVFSATGEDHVPASDGGEPLVIAGSARLARYGGTVDAVLIDTAGGGTGRTFDWSVIDSYVEAAKDIGVPLYVAGGLHPDNVSELLEAYAPSGVDVSSGVETDGWKDTNKIRHFVERVKRK